MVVNRLLATLIGLLMLATGVTGLALGLGALGSAPAHAAPVPASVPQQAMAPSANALMGLAVAGLLALLLGLVLLRVELRVRARGRMGALRYKPASSGQGRPRGRTVVRGGGLEHGARQSLEALPGVRSAQAQLAGNSERPDLLIELEIDAQTQLSTLKSEVRQAIERFRLTSGRQPSTQVQIRLANARRSVD
jgi:hypothetical protein